MRMNLLLMSAVLMATTALAGSPPLQADLTLAMPAENGSIETARSGLDGGDANVAVRAVNLDNGDTVRVRLRFSYRIDPDTIAFDEILDRIVVETIGDGGAAIGMAEIDPHEVNLNPNRVALVYQLTLYRPSEAYTLRVRIFGNYE